MTSSESCDFPAFVVSRKDNVATLLEPVAAGSPVRLLGEIANPPRLSARQNIPSAHKIALAEIKPGAPIVKYGHRIGHASRKISAGEWVHLHNCASDVDERSNTLNVHTGAPEDTRAAYE